MIAGALYLVLVVGVITFFSGLQFTEPIYVARKAQHLEALRLPFRMGAAVAQLAEQLFCLEHRPVDIA